MRAAAVWGAVFLLVFVGMEGVAWASHRFLMHGPLWHLHRSHHEPHRGGWEANDWFGVFFSLPSMGLIAAGAAGRPLLLAAGAGMAAYGLAYLVFHDGLVHGRFGRFPTPRHPWLVRLVVAHRLHHARRTREGCRAFGFLWAPPRSSRRSRAGTPAP